MEGLLIAMANIDEVVDIIKTSKTQSEAKERLNVRFGLTDKQSQAILDMRLGRLTGLEHDKIQAERDGLVETIAYYESVLADENKLLGIIREEILEVRRKYADPRRTEIAQITEDIELDDIIQPEEMTVTLTHFGFAKRTSMDTYKAQNRGGRA